ncbi:acyltransferase family protein [Streptomyces alkaliphilus]|uniref:acyltransferase family protein n=1 Tax=Streptomyces alkaliphilus TaxID=1472722 RepID=UPI001564FC0B|nr:acyltransferase [Streptomyces alkaliphilus]
MTTSQVGVGTTGEPPLLPSLTSMRFLIATIIFLFHGTNFVLFASPGVGERYLSLVTMGGWAGMSFFFILSGFVLTWVARPDNRTGTFLRRRLVRIFPNHLVIFALTAILMVTVLGQAFDGPSVVLNVLLLQAWSPALDVRIGFNAVSWSLSAELLFYLCFPALLLLVRRIRPERLWAWTIGLLAVIALVVPLAAKLLPRQEVMPFLELSQEQFWILFHFPPVRMLEFLVGMLLARIVMTGRRVPLGFGGAAALSVLAYAVGPLFPPEFRMVAVMVVPMSLLIVTGAVSDLNRTRRTLLSSRPMVYLGHLAYAFYLVHMQVLVYGTHWLAPGRLFDTPSGIAMLVLLFCVAVAFSWVLYKVVEQPMMRRFGADRRTPRAVPPTDDTARPATDEPAAATTPRTAGVGH